MARIKKSDEEIRSEIIKAASNLFRKYGYLKTTMEDIAKAIRKGKSTLYYYYKSKDDVFLDVLTRESDSIITLIHERVNKIESAEDKLIQYFEIIIQEAIRVSNFYILMLDELRNESILHDKVDTIYADKDIEFIENIIKYGIERKEFLATKLEDARRVAELISLSTKNLIIHYFIPGKTEEWTENFRLLGGIILRGLS